VRGMGLCAPRMDQPAATPNGGAADTSVERAPDVVVERAPDSSVGRLVVKNTLFLTLAQVLTIPLSVLVNAAMARYLGPEEFGYVYLALTIVGFGFTVVDWGHTGALPALVARDRTRAGVILGTSLVWRLALSIVVYAVLAAGLHWFDYGAPMQWALAFTFLGWLLNSVVAACKDTIRGFERTDIPSYVHVGQQLLSTVLCVGVLVLGGRMRAVLIAGAAAAALVLLPIWRTLRPVGVGKLAYERGAVRALFVEGTPFVLFGLAMTLVPYIDAMYLSKLSPPDVMGWYAASRRLVGVLLLPASALIGALYPTLCRLWTTDKPGFNDATSGSLRGTALIVVPVALGCALYPELGVAIFSSKSFGPTEENLQVLSIFLVLVYFSMPIGTALMAAGRQRVWTVVMLLCVLVSLLLDPPLIRFFEARFKNGGMGVCVASVVSELVVVVAGIAMMPKGVFDRRFVRSFLLSLLAGGAMAAVAFGTRWLNPFVAAPLALLAYGVVIVATGGIEKHQIEMVRSKFQRVLGRFKGG
jgi:O-antigen/teichoic acid export membrane protein